MNNVDNYAGPKGSKFLTWTYFSLLWAVIFFPAKWLMIAYTISIFIFLLFKKNSSFTQLTIPYHMTWGVDPNSQLQILPGSLNSNHGNTTSLVVAQPRNGSVCWEATRKGLLLPEKRHIRKKWSQGSSDIGGLGPCRHLAANLSRKPTLCGDQIQVGELHGHCHTAAKLQLTSDILMWDNKCPHLDQFKTVWGRVFCYLRPKTSWLLPERFWTTRALMVL